MKEIIELLKQAVCLELVVEDLNIDLNSKTNDIDAYAKSINNEELAKIVYDSLISYSLSDDDVNMMRETFSDSELRRYAINTSIRVLLNDEKEDPMSLNQLYEKNKSLGFYGDLLMELFLHAFYGTGKLVCRGKLYDPNSRMEPTGFDAFHIISDSDTTEFWLGESKISNSKYPSDTIKDIIFSFDRVFKEEYLRKNLLLITKRNLTTANNKFNIFLEENKFKLGLKNIALVNEMITKINIDAFIYPIFICFEMKNSIEESLEYVKSKVIECVEIFRDQKGDLSSFNELDAKIFFILFPLESVDEYRKAVLRWIIQENL